MPSPSQKWRNKRTKYVKHGIKYAEERAGRKLTHDEEAAMRRILRDRFNGNKGWHPAGQGTE